MKTLFGTDGLRGEAGKYPLDAATVRIVGMSLARLLVDAAKRTPNIVIGRDTRESGAWLEQALIEGATSVGARCESAGVITTPGIAFLTRFLPADAGVVISASHNPYHDNGIKIFAPSGQKFDDSVERLIEADILSNEHTAPKQIAGGKLIDDKDLSERYVDFLAGEIGTGLSLVDLTLVIDCANGAASSIAPILFERLGARVIAINNQPDGRNINKDCGSLHLEVLRRRVVSEQADLGVALDGDADRALFIDDLGDYVDGDATLWVLANYLHDRADLCDGVVVATVMSNLGLEVALLSQGLRLVRTQVGDKYVLEELLRLNASLGGEQSGHIILPRLSLAGDGMITTLCLLRSMRETRKSLRELTVGFEHYPQILVNVTVREKPPFSEIPAVREAADQVEKKLADRGRLLLRYSGTEPLARIMIEGQNQQEIETYAQELASVIRKYLGAS